MVRLRKWWIWAAPALFLLVFSLSLSNLAQLSPTFDEQGFITRGLGYLRDENRQMRVGHPLGLNALNAFLLVGDESVQLPFADPSWELTNFHRPSELFLWEIGNDVGHVMFLARLPTVWLGLLLIAVVGRWAFTLTRSQFAAFMAMVLVGLDPNLLANGRLATTDFGLATFALLAGFLLWRFGKRPSWPRAIWAGVGFGLLQNTKFTAGLFVPLFAIVLLLFVVGWFFNRKERQERQERKDFPAVFSSPRSRRLIFSRQSPLVMLLVAYPLAAFVTLWAAYGFQIGTLPDNLPTLPQLSGLTLPLSHHLEQLLDIGGRLQKSTPAFLAGSYSDSGWWSYFPVAFLLKTPLPTLILLITAVSSLIWLVARRKLSGRWLTLAALLIPPLGYFGIALTTDINLGYRHLLPVLPYFAVFVAAVLGWLADCFPRQQRLGQLATVGLLAWLGGSTVWLAPHYLAFFNALAGGPDGGWRYLVDSNIDWGQDLGGLKDWLDENGVDQVWLSYFGEGRPDYYGINYIGLDSFPPRLMNLQARPFFPHDPAPGIYAISATNLQGVHFANHDQFAWFRDKEPLDKIGYSIFIYEVTPRGEPADVVLAGVQLDEIAPEDFASFQTNQIVPRWLNNQAAFLQPAADEFWLVVGSDIGAGWDVATELVVHNDRYAIYRLQNDGAETAVSQSFRLGDSKIEFLGGTELSQQSDVVQLTTRWRNETGPVPLKIYVHLLDASGQIVSQWDGLDAAWEGWRAGDRLWQQHELRLPAPLSVGRYQLHVGLYDPETAVRWQTAAGTDFVAVGTIEVEP